MEPQPERALIQKAYLMPQIHHQFCRNGALAREGIDTILLHMKSSLFASGRNGALAREGIDTILQLEQTFAKHL